MRTIIKHRIMAAITGRFHAAFNNAPSAMTLTQNEVRRNRSVFVTITNSCNDRADARTRVRSERLLGFN